MGTGLSQFNYIKLGLWDPHEFPLFSIWYPQSPAQSSQQADWVMGITTIQYLWYFICYNQGSMMVADGLVPIGTRASGTIMMT